MNGLYRCSHHQNVLQSLLHQSPPLPSSSSSRSFKPRPLIRSDGSDLWKQLLGGRGLPGGEAYLKDESKRKTLIDRMNEAQGAGSPPAQKPSKAEGGVKPSEASTSSSASSSSSSEALLDGFEKEMMGLTGGFPGGETGLKKFIEENPPPPPPPPSSSSSSSVASLSDSISRQSLTRKPSAPPLPLLMPGMTVIVKNAKSPFHMYGGIVQRVSDGRVGVLLEGGNWDKLLTFYLEELERTPSGPPMTNPKSAVILLDELASSQ